MRENAKTAKNGMKLYSYKNPAQHSFFLSLFVKAGCMYETADECGITHFFEHVAIRNVNKLMGGGLYAELDRLGMEFNASTFSEMVQFYVSGASGHIRRGGEILSRVLSPIALDKREIDAERKRIKAEIRESDDKNTLTTFTAKTVYEGTSLAGSIVGTNGAVDRINGARLEKYRKKILNTENVFLYVTGNFEDEDLDYIAQLFGAVELPTAPPRQNIAPIPALFGKRGGEVYIKNADFTMLRFTFDLDMKKVSVPATDLIYDILLSGYNSKLFIEMSEKRGLFYDVVGANERYSNVGSFYFSFEVKERDVYEAAELAISILRELKEAPLDLSECMRAGYVDNAMMLYDDARELNFTFAYDNHIMNLGYETIEQRREAYAGVTPEKIMQTAKEIFKPENLTLTMKAKKKQIKVDKIKEIIAKL